jgi:hypothetical protein
MALERVGPDVSNESSVLRTRKELVKKRLRILYIRVAIGTEWSNRLTPIPGAGGG